MLNMLLKEKMRELSQLEESDVWEVPREKSQLAKALAIKAGDPTSIPRTHMVRGRKQTWQVVL